MDTRPPLDKEAVGELLTRKLVLLRVGPEDDTPETQVFTGFVVELRDRWVWITARHCVSAIEALSKARPEFGFRLMWFPEDGGCTWADLPDGNLQVLDGSSIMSKRLVMAGHPKSELPSKDEFDVAAMFLPVEVRATLADDGVTPFTEVQCSRSFEEFETLCEDDVMVLWCMGVPYSDHYLDRVTGTMKFNTVVFPLGEKPPDGRRVANQGMFWWIPTGWGKDKGYSNTKGCSGGPVVYMTGEEPTLMGVWARQRGTPPDHPTHIGVAEVGLLLTILGAELDGIANGALQGLQEPLNLHLQG